MALAQVVGDGGDSFPVLRGNSIHHANQCGILVTNEARGLIEDNEIFENRWPAPPCLTHPRPRVGEGG